MYPAGMISYEIHIEWKLTFRDRWKQILRPMLFSDLIKIFVQALKTIIQA